MTTESKTSSGDAASSKAASKPSHKLPDDFVPNEPVANTGVDEKGVPDGTLSPHQLERAANEALLALRPQPTKEQIILVLDKINARDAKGQPVLKCKTAKEAGDKAVSLLSGNDTSH
jgi:hypothetical protein